MRPQEGLDTLTLNFRLPTGQVESWVFNQNTHVEVKSKIIRVYTEKL
jgi:hypothetical protein